tara:strand:- start:2737 stop:3609 length:873 start_codon:yes stop_codon:yes gene_type:complete
MLKQRILTALVLIPLVIGALFRLPIEPYSYTVMGILAIGAWEWARMSGVSGQLGRLGFAGFFVAVCLLIQFTSPHYELWLVPNTWSYKTQPWIDATVWIGILWWLIAAFLVFSFPRSQKLWTNPYIALGMGLSALLPAWVSFVIIRSIDYVGDPLRGSVLLVGLLLIIWAADIGAYFAGKAFGRHKLAPSVSPGKSIEGAIGGAVAACVFLPGFIYITSYVGNVFYLVLCALLIVVVSIFGDLTESMFKRVSGIKDSSNILPGHGGIYDRLDSLIAALPFYVILQSLVLG